MNVWTQLEEYLKENHGKTLPEIRYFDGTDAYSDIHGNFKAKSVEESVQLFLKEQNERQQ